MSLSSCTRYKSTTLPIALPHDGPICRAFLRNNQFVSQDRDILSADLETTIVELDDTVVDRSVLFLLHAITDVKKPVDAVFINDKLTLLRTLINATDIHEQLRTLQKFRNKIMQNQRRSKEQLDSDFSVVKSELSTDTILYRILLEWMISIRTSVSLRRAIASCLSALVPSLPRENGDNGVITRNNVPFDVLKSILQPCHHDVSQIVYWCNPLHSLNELMLWGSMKEFFNTEAWIVEILTFLQSQSKYEMEYHALGGVSTDVDCHVTLMANVINKILVMAALRNYALTKTYSDTSLNDIVADLQLYLWNAMLRHDIPIDRLSNIGIAYGRTVQWQLQHDSATSITSSTSVILERVLAMSSILQRAAVLQGLAVVVPLHTSSVQDLMIACRHIFLEAADPDVRCLALKGVRTLVSRINSFYSSAKNIDDDPLNYHPQEVALDLDDVRRLADETLHIILQAWENPPTRKLANAIPALFESLIQLMLEVSDDNILDELTEQLLAQAPNLKGRYLGLEIIMPIVGASRLVESNSSLLHDLLVGIGDQGHNTGVMADLWANLVRQLHIEYYEQVHLQPLKNGRQLASSDWLNSWVPSLVRALVSKDVIRRKQVAAFCLPRVFAMEINISTQPTHISSIFNAFFESLELLSSDVHFLSDRRSIHGGTLLDRILWAELEILRYSAVDGLLKTSSECTSSIRDKVAVIFPKTRLQSVLIHDLPTIRVTALQVMEFVIRTYGPTTTSPLDYIRWEIELWMFALPSSVKTDGKENILSIHQCLLLFLDRLLKVEASSYKEIKWELSKPLPLFHSFVVDFLLHDIILQKTGYPGSVPLKEAFLLSLMECVIVFSLRDHPLATDSKLLPKNASVFTRRRDALEEIAIFEIKKSLSSIEIFDCLITLLHSTWDSTRTGSYRILASLVHLSYASLLRLPALCTDVTSRKGLLSRGIFLASSPRQREADTGAKMISFIYLSLTSVDEKRELLGSLIDLLDRRLVCMKQRLSTLLSCSDNHTQVQHLPLAHGIIHALRLVTECSDLPLLLPVEQLESKDAISSMFDRIISLFFKAIRVSLAVVADVKDGEIVDGMDEDILLDLEGTKSTSMVNPSAIGANGIFSSVNHFSPSENAKRLASQRIVVGSWLLTKETCAAVAAILSSSYTPSSSVYNEAGILLISTLTSLKHTGAAFAAHRALQRIAQNCYLNVNKQTLFDLPNNWALRLVAEVSDCEKIRDSILRRSTGYSLGFLSLMRAEVSMRKQHPLCVSLLRKITRLCLPSRSQWDEFAAKLQLSENLKSSLFPFSIHDCYISLVADADFSVQARVHALNVLRACLLDAPIANEIFPFVGFAFIAAMVGYTDSEWSIRNSSTMVFAAAMLRSIDPDKNGSRIDVTGRNTITADELFRAYAPLAPFLLAVLNGAVRELFEVQQSLSLPPLLPILLLLSRIQPVSQSGEKSILQIEPFVPLVLKFLNHKQMSIRKCAARAIRNMVSGEKNSITYVYSILACCLRSLSLFTNFDFVAVKGGQWNHLHGLLLTLRELVIFFPETKDCFRGSNSFEDLHLLTKVYGGSLKVPPLCVMVATEVIWHLSQNHDCKRLLLLCKEITLYVERNHRVGLHDVGSAELSAQVALISANILCSTVFASPVSSDEKDVALQHLSCLFHSDCIDLRCATVKAFKKFLRGHIENLPDTNMPDDHQADVVAELLHTAIRFELGRDLSGGTHTPTLRRLSRCLVEWRDPSLKTRQAALPVNSHLKFEVMAWSLFKRGTPRRTLPCDPFSIPQLDGNALEIVSLEGKNFAAEDIKMLGLLIKRFSNPSCHWRVRLSAARSLHRLLEMLVYDSAMFSPPEQISLLDVWITLLQDEDDDVRLAAAQATRKLSYLRTDTSITDFSLIHEFSDGIEGTLKVLVDELSQSETSESFPVVVNDSAMQAIFEKESPNSFVEVCFIGQLVIATILAISQSVPVHLYGNGLVVSTNAFLKYVHTILTQLQHCVSNKAILYNLSRNNMIFPCLHNLLITTITLIYVAGGSVVTVIDDIQLVTENIVSALTRAGGLNTIHPLVLRAMQSLLRAKQSSLDTMKALQQCCFLVSRQD